MNKIWRLFLCVILVIIVLVLIFNAIQGDFFKGNCDIKKGKDDLKNSNTIDIKKNKINKMDKKKKIILKKIRKSKTKKNFEKKTAIIVEPRKCEALPYVLNNFFENLDETWSFNIFCGNLNKEFVEEFLTSNSFTGNRKVKVFNLNVDNLSIDKYNDLFLSQYFYDTIETEIFLVFQTDTLILKKTNYFINYFYKFDYCGAPWKQEAIDESKTRMSYTELNYSCVGNGGLSLRKKSKMLELLNDYNENNFLEKNEDMIFSGFLTNKIKIKKPSEIEAMFFSIEHVFSPYSFGIHKLWDYMNEKQYKYLLQDHPDIKIIENLYKKINKKNF